MATVLQTVVAGQSPKSCDFHFAQFELSEVRTLRVPLDFYTHVKPKVYVNQRHVNVITPTYFACSYVDVLRHALKQMAKRIAARGAKPAKAQKGKAGRPPLPPSDVRSEELVIPLTEAELRELRDAATADRERALATWARRVLLIAAARPVPR